jgi:hypothetical protein
MTRKMTNTSTLRAMWPSIVLPGFVGLLLLFVNSLPRVQCEPRWSQDGIVSQCSLGEAHYGWPKTTKIDTIIQTTNDKDYRQSRYSLRHFFGLQPFQVQLTQRSEYAGASNVIFAVAAMLLSAVSARAIMMKKISLRSLFAMVTAVGIITATFTWNCFM